MGVTQSMRQDTHDFYGKARRFGDEEIEPFFIDDRELAIGDRFDRRRMRQVFNQRHLTCEITRMESLDFLSANQNPRLARSQNVHQARRITLENEGSPGTNGYQTRIVPKQ
jgi:hypothetical protein